MILIIIIILLIIQIILIIIIILQAESGAVGGLGDARRCICTPGLHYKIPVFSDPAPGKS